MEDGRADIAGGFRQFLVAVADIRAGQIFLRLIGRQRVRGGAEEVLIDASEACGGAAFCRLELEDPSPDGRYLYTFSNGMLAIAVVNPLAMSVLKPPGEWGDAAGGGADIACGEGQPLGAPLSSGGPYFGFMCGKQSLVRQMPGRIIGKTVDLEGRPGFTLTLQAREQHIRRSKATSNICTNQGLLVTAATIHMALLGGEGLARVAAACHANTAALVGQLGAVDGVEPLFAGPVFHEAVLQLAAPAKDILRALAVDDVLGTLVAAAPLMGLLGRCISIARRWSRSTMW